LAQLPPPPPPPLPAPASAPPAVQLVVSFLFFVEKWVCISVKQEIKVEKALWLNSDASRHF
jgi:hypothetical protein